MAAEVEYIWNMTPLCYTLFVCLESIVNTCLYVMLENCCLLLVAKLPIESSSINNFWDLLLKAQSLHDSLVEGTR